MQLVETKLFKYNTLSFPYKTIIFGKLFSKSLPHHFHRKNLLVPMLNVQSLVKVRIIMV